MKNIVLPTLLLCFLSGLLFGQSVSPQGTFLIKGRLLDGSSHEPLQYATVSVFPQGAKKPVSGAVADSKGEFKIEKLPAGTYRVVAEFIGYKSSALPNVTLGSKEPVANLRDVFLQTSATTLQGVTISGKPKIVENKIDKLVFNAEQDITSQIGVATDVLRKVPMVSVDVDGNVELAGNSSIRFLIDGKPSAAFGSNITDVLQAIPASQIKSIEVITSPGAKYDAQGLGGIINIILKKNTSRGVNGNLSLTGGTRMENGSFNFNARKNNFGLNAFISGDTRLRSTTISSSNRVTSDTAANTTVYLDQNGNSHFTRGGLQGGLGFDWDLNKHNGLSGSVSYRDFSHLENSSTAQSQLTKDAGDNLLADMETTINNDHVFHFHNLDANLNYKKTFSREDQELDLSASSSTGSRKASDNSYLYLMPQDSLYYSTKGVNPGTENESEFKVDYTQPFKNNVLLGVGGKLGRYDITNNSTVLKLNGTDAYTRDAYLSDNLTYHQNVYALYSELTFPVFKWFDAKVGERYERTEINSYYSDAQQQQKVPGYNTFVPSVYFSRKIGDNSMIKLSYSKRIERPDYRDLDPFINTSDPKNLTAGNVHLKPELGKRYELSYNTDIDQVGSFMVGIFYRINLQDIQPFIVYYPSYQVGDTTYTDVAVSTRQNIGRENNIGVNAFGSLKLFSKLDLRTNLFFYKRHTINVIDKGYDYSSFNYHINLNADYQFSKTLVAEAFGNFRSAIHQAQGTYPSFTSYSLAIRKQFWRKKASVALTASNPFHKTLDQHTRVYGPEFVNNSYRAITFRSFGLNFTWKFGKLEFKEDKSQPDQGLNPPPDNG